MEVTPRHPSPLCPLKHLPPSTVHVQGGRRAAEQGGAQVGEQVEVGWTGPRA